MNEITFEELCKEVNRRALRIYGQAGNGHANQAVMQVPMEFREIIRLSDSAHKQSEISGPVSVGELPRIIRH